MITQKTVSICNEVDSLLGLVVVAVKDVKSGKTAGQVFADLEAQLISSLTGIGDLKTEIADKKDMETTVALKGSELVDAFLG